MSGGNPSGLKDNESGCSEISEANQGETDHRKLSGGRQRMSGEHPNGLQDNESRGPEVSNTNEDTDDRELDALQQQQQQQQQQQVTGERLDGSQENERRGSEASNKIYEEDTRDGHKDSYANVEFLDLSSAIMDSKESQLLARAMERGELKNLKILVLDENHGDFGMRAMLNALRRKHLVGLRKLFLWEVSSYDQITVAEEGTEVIADALKAGALPNVEVVDMRGSLPRLQPSRKRFEALRSLFTKCSLGDGRLNESMRVCVGCLVCNTRPGQIQTLECLRCLVGKLHVYSGDSGIRKLGQALKACPMETLKELYLQQNYIGDKGASDLAKILRRGLLPSLERLDLQNNPVGKEGAENIIFAFLRNPLLTARVHMKWPNRLHRQRYVAFRESNIRLEVRLKDPDFNIEAGRVAKRKFDYPRYNWGRSREQSHQNTLRLKCQADCKNREEFEDHEVKIGGKDGAGCVEPDGIESRVLPIFTTSPKSYVDREGEEQSVPYSGPMNDKSGDLQVKYLTMSGPVSSMRRAVQEVGEADLKRTKGVNRIWIKKPSLGFFASAEAFDSQERRSSSDPPKWLFERLWGWLGDRTKPNEAMKTIMQELLMLADRKPDEFFQLFGLRQVLLKDPTVADEEEEDVYSRRWICNSCFLEYKSHYGDLVFPITTDRELGIEKTETDASKL